MPQKQSHRVSFSDNNNIYTLPKIPKSIREEHKILTNIRSSMDKYYDAAIAKLKRDKNFECIVHSGASKA